MFLPALHYLPQNRWGKNFELAAVILLASMTNVLSLPAQSGSGCGQSEATNAKTCFQAKGDLRSADRCSMTSGSGALRCSGGSFVAGDVGKSVYVQSAGSSGRSLAFTIRSYVSASEVDVTPVATSTVSNVSSVWGTDDTSALQSAYKAVVAQGGALYIPPGIICIMG